MDDIFRLRPVQKLKGLVLRSLRFRNFSHLPENSCVKLQHSPTKLPLSVTVVLQNLHRTVQQQDRAAFAGTFYSLR